MKKTLDMQLMKSLGYMVSGSFLFIHIALFLFFRRFGVLPMAEFNIFSIVFYLLSVLLLKYEKFWLYVISVYLEVLLHMSLAVVFVGTDGGFQVTLIGMILIGFYSEYLSNKFDTRRISGILLGCMALLIYLASYVYSHFVPAPYALPESVCFWMQLTWGFVVFAVNIFFLKIFVSIALHSEALLAAAQTQANSMVTALSSDYRSVYYVNLDTDTGICYRGGARDPENTPEGTEFPYYAHFSEYGRRCVTESYREGFLSFIEPRNIRDALAENPVIAYRYLAERDGHEYYEMIRMAGVRLVEDRTDHTVHAIGLGLTDIDEEMRRTMAKNEALAEALVLAEEASKAKTSFLSSMSHEIRTPMNAIIGLDTLALRDDTVSPQTREYLEKIGASARHLLALINDILDMSRIESGRMVLRREEFSFRAMLEQINTMVSSQCGDKGIRYACRILSPVDDRYIGDDMKLKEVLINILSNAIKFTDPPGSVTLTVERTAMFEDQSTLQFRIKDTGIGMDPDYIPKIFDAFSQEDSSRKNKYGSTGLGMAITRNLVEMMNGTIDVESEKGVGTEFTVTLTLRNRVCEAPGQEKAIERGSIHALVADADAVSAEHARMVLEEAGIRAESCTSREEGMKMLDLQQLKQDPYNLVLLDRNLSGADALAAFTELRAHYAPESTAVIMTAYNWDDIRDRAERAGADSLLTKPLFAENVLREFERLVHRNDMCLACEKPRADLRGRRILLAEDVEINAEIMKAILEMNEMEVDHAGNGRIVLEMFRDSAPGTYAAILMDVRMPEMDGLEAAAAIRALERPDAGRIPIIALTANAFDEDVQRSLQAGMNAHLTKPVEPEQLVQALGEYIHEAEAPHSGRQTGENGNF